MTALCNMCVVRRWNHCGDRKRTVTPTPGSALVVVSSELRSSSNEPYLGMDTRFVGTRAGGDCAIQGTTEEATTPPWGPGWGFAAVASCARWWVSCERRRNVNRIHCTTIIPSRKDLEQNIGATGSLETAMVEESKIKGSNHESWSKRERKCFCDSSVRQQIRSRIQSKATDQNKNNKRYAKEITHNNGIPWYRRREKVKLCGDIEYVKRLFHTMLQYDAIHQSKYYDGNTDRNIIIVDVFIVHRQVVG